MAFFKTDDKKNEEPAFGAPSTPPPVNPAEKLVEMKDQGFSDNKISQNMQSEGYSPTETFDAMEQSGMRNAADLGQTPKPAAFPNEPPVYEGAAEDQIEEIAEAIIEEKWNELVKNVNKIIEWKDRTESRITQMEQKIKDIKSDFDNLHSAVLGKVGEYDQNLTNIGAEIKAMEKVFQKLLPTFSENVSELSRLTKDLKKKK
ncbi:hypothetical protein HQ529_00025 [Candidatus Woesearchaeota archaeon]|nr:hypothetical protein [Candidatus Woesearchaeota archaeon]